MGNGDGAGDMTAIPQQEQQRLKVTVRGAVQGVGFRPFVFRLAGDLSLAGWVSNSTGGVSIEVEGPHSSLEEFLLKLEKERPPRSSVQSLEFSFLDPIGYRHFIIRESSAEGSKTALVLPDIATCPDCLHELSDSHDRRYRYPFTNCTNCGPRFSIIHSLPYDRSRTSMSTFTMCDECRREYEDPHDRRFHAQPNACPQCGPHLELWDKDGTPLESHDPALLSAAAAIRDGRIVAVKGLGGFHLMVDARNDDAVARLRQRKHREEKPFAVMYPSLDEVHRQCDVSPLEERLLRSPESPIVLLRRRSAEAGIAEGIAPRNPYLGILLPYTPLHHLLMKEIKHPVVATSGNISDEPICVDETEAVERLGTIADLFLVHNRPIVRHVDDSIGRVILDRELIVRRARGYAPLPIESRQKPSPPVLAVGAHLKNSIALSSGTNVFISQHIGDLETRESLEAFHTVIEDFQRLYESAPAVVACDLHPDYLSTQFAHSLGLPVEKVQHHFAHVVSCMAENDLEGELLGVSWDGTGYGPDGTVWGGEFLIPTEDGYRRVAALRTFSLPGGEQAVREPRRSALGLLYELYGPAVFTDRSIRGLLSFTEQELRILRQTVEKGINSPRTSSIGRLFDAIASILDHRQQVNFEGQAAMELEFLATGHTERSGYNMTLLNAGKETGEFPFGQIKPSFFLDWEPMIQDLLIDLRSGIDHRTISARFHNGLGKAIVAVARRVGLNRVVLTGGCFQNKYLTEHTVSELRKAGFQPYWHQRVPPNDGGISVGQAFAAIRRSEMRNLRPSGQTHQNEFADRKD